MVSDEDIAGYWQINVQMGVVQCAVSTLNYSLIPQQHLYEGVKHLAFPVGVILSHVIGFATAGLHDQTLCHSEKGPNGGVLPIQQSHILSPLSLNKLTALLHTLEKQQCQKCYIKMLKMILYPSICSCPLKFYLVSHLIYLGLEI